MQRKQVPETIDEYSADLRKRLSGILPDEKIEEAVAEAEAHLQESAEALRQETDLYEKQAVARFVPSRSMARGLSRAWAATYLRHGGTKWLQNISAILYLVALGWILARLLIVSKLPVFLQETPIAGLPLIVAPVLVFLLAAIACRSQLRLFVCGGLAALVLFFTLGGWLCALTPRFFCSRFDAPALFQDRLVILNFQQKEIKWLRDGLGHYGSIMICTYRGEYDFSYFSASKIFGYLKNIETKSNSQREIESIHKNMYKQVMGGKAEYQRKLPDDLKLGQGFVVPLKFNRAEPGLISAFRGISMSDELAVMNRVGMVRQGQTLVSACHHYPLETATTPIEALRRWNTDGPEQLKRLSDSYALRREEAGALWRLMSSQERSFDLPAARFMAKLGASFVGMLLLADLIGGWLGSWFLRGLRRRRSFKDMRLKS
jgi:hypothetical protein